MPCQPVPCGKDQAVLFGRGDARRRATKIAARAQSHLDEDSRGAVATDEVDLATLDAEIAFDNTQAALLEQIRCRRLGGITCGLAARHLGIEWVA